MMPEDSLNEEFDFYFRLLKDLTDGICITNKALEIIFWNDSMEKAFDFAQTEVMGRSVLDVLRLKNTEDGEGLLNLEKLTKIAHENRSMNMVCEHKQGHGIVMQIRVNLFVNQGKEENGFILIFTDILVKATIERAVKELEEIAYIDKLTELPNRRFLENEFDKHLNSLRRYGIAFGTLLVDIDHFKKVNDTYGHDNGDRVLKALGQILIDVTRKDDIKARWGGEEFVILTQLADSEKLSAFGERLRKIIEGTRIEIPEKKLMISFTISIGLTLSKTGDDKNTIMKRCDEMLYKSKSEGRNRVSGIF